MNAHLALHCQKVPAEVKQDRLRNFPIPKRNKTAIDIATGVQPRIDNKFQQTKKLDPGQEQLCHKSLTKFFVCCGIPFWTVESPFFLDLETFLFTSLPHTFRSCFASATVETSSSSLSCIS